MIAKFIITIVWLYLLGAIICAIVVLETAWNSDKPLKQVIAELVSPGLRKMLPWMWLSIALLALVGLASITKGFGYLE